MKKQIRIGVTSDIIPADSPLMSGQGVYSACKGDFESIFSNFQEYCQKFDFLIGNFEAVLVKDIVKVSPGTSAMKAPVSVLPVLEKCGFKFMSIANNHTMEYGPDAFHWMCDTFDEYGIQTFGHKDRPLLIIKDDERDIKVGVLSFSTVPAMYGFVPEYYYVDFSSPAEVDSLLKHVNVAKSKCDQLLVYPHWGSEFMTKPAPWQIKLAKQMIFNGADAILGAHPHIIQDAGFIDGKPVFFSLGNLLSDYFQEHLKRNVVISANVGKESLYISGRIFTTSRDFVIFDTKQDFPVHNFVETDESEAKYASEANYIRKKVRNELVLYLLKFPLRWIFNRGLWIWLISRAWFLVSNARRIKENPNAVYSGPIH